MARIAVSKVVIRKEGGFTRESIQEAYDTIGQYIDRASAEALEQDFETAGLLFKNQLLADAPFDEADKRVNHVHLRDAIFFSPGRPTRPWVYVGVNFGKAPQGYWLEYGTSKMDAHPWFKAALLAVREQMAQIIADGIKATISGERR